MSPNKKKTEVRVGKHIWCICCWKSSRCQDTFQCQCFWLDFTMYYLL